MDKLRGNKIILTGRFVPCTYNKLGLWRVLERYVELYESDVPNIRVSHFADAKLDGNYTFAYISENEAKFFADNRNTFSARALDYSFSFTGGNTWDNTSAKFTFNTCLLNIDVNEVVKEFEIQGIDLVNCVVTTTNYNCDQIPKYERRWSIADAPGCALGKIDDYYHGVGSEMWLGPRFWPFAKCTKEDLLTTPWLECSDVGNLLHVKAWPKPFDSDQGKQGEIQHELIRMLFGNKTE